MKTPALIFLWTPRTLIGMIGMLVSCLFFCAGSIQAVDDGTLPSIGVEFVSITNISLEELAAGAVGDGRILYFVQNGDQRSLRLLVHLHRESEETTSIAEVYDIPINLDPYSDPLSLTPADAAIIMEASNGWWVRDGTVNYNLNIKVFGQVGAMWGATLDVKSGPQYNWPRLLEPGEPNAEVIVRDTNNDGIPDWDWRTMLPEFPNRGDLRTNYAERKCDSPLTADLGASPQWPYVALEGSFEQEKGRLRPPIVVDWETGKVNYFSELVTVRNQNCSYSIYSIERVLPGQLQSPNFETPFAFYDLSGEGVGYPNLLLRTQRTIENEPLVLASNPETQSIRYSWRNEVGDWQWDYKVDVLGQYRYDFQTPIAGGEALIDAPPYEAFPDWVISRDWPATSFVAMGDALYRSSEGIYEWSMLGTAEDFFFGWQQEADLSQFEDIRSGLRGEYRLNSVHTPETYLSPIDNRLHLKWAEHGIWRLDSTQIIRVANLDNDETIDVWSRETMDTRVEEDDPRAILSNGTPTAETATQATPKEPMLIEALYALDGYLLHTNGETLTLVASDYEPIVFETLPPMDHDTWETQRAQLAPYEAQRRDPSDLLSWLDAFPGPRNEITGASVNNVRIIDGGFRFELILEPGYRISGPDLLGLTNLAPGAYSVENNADTFAVAALVPPELNLDIRQFAVSGGPAANQVTVSNASLADASGLMLVVDTVDENGTAFELTRKSVDALAKETEEVLLDIPASAAGTATMRVRLEDAKGQVVAATDLTDTANPSGNPDGILSIGQVPVLIPVAALFAIVLAGTAVMAIARRREQSAA